ncbi:hypothetical protein F5Y10DRAFT_283755 [Nemania abortiva]|nr:hypothetical protein F5Y10DRAFT_283755 [Nemania abortiva]
MARPAFQVPGRGGWNANFGWDTDGGPPPIAQSYGAAAPAMPAAMPAMAPSIPPPMPAMPYGGFAAPAMNMPGYPMPQYGYPGANPGDPSQRVPQPHPRVSFEFNGMNMVNSTGGAGCEPGYNYIFHGEHTKIHIFRTTEPPWRAPSMNYSFAKFQVPTNTTIAELMFKFGACNPNAMLNRITEVIEGGGGQWYRGMIFQGDQEADCQKTLKDVGWDGTRTGREKSVVWLWVTKD